MKRILVAGATGYLGQYMVRALKNHGYWVRALGRSKTRLAPVSQHADELFIGEATDPDSIIEVCDGIDVVFSSLGITRQKDGLTYKDVDYQANRNLLSIAEASGASRFVYVHVLNSEKLQHVVMVQAKQAFVDELTRSALETTVIRPTGFFSDMEEFLSMARSGHVFLIGDGSSRINPIHGADLAEVCVKALDSAKDQVDVGGPEVFTYRQIAGFAFETLGKPRKITCLPQKLVTTAVAALRWVAPVKTHGPIQFLTAVMTMDVVAEPFGERRLHDHFRDCVRADAEQVL